METVEFVNDMISLIKEKKELRTLDDNFVQKYLDKFLPNYKIDYVKYKTFKQFKKSSMCKEIVSAVRGKLREVYGVFIKKSSTTILKKIKSLISFKDAVLIDLLESHQSTMERIPHYTSFYKEIFNILFELGLKEDFNLVDLACGFNPLGYQFLPIKPKEYIVSDLSSNDMEMINTFFNITSINGIAFSGDLLTSETIEKINSKGPFDLCFFFKALDSLESVSRHSSKKILSAINSRFFVVTFPLISIGGGSIISSDKRYWFENFCNNQGWKLIKRDFANELVYIIEKTT